MLKSTKLVYYYSIKSKSLQGNAVKTIYGVDSKGIVIIERFTLSDFISPNSQKIIRTFIFGEKAYYYQSDSIAFKLPTFLQICKDIQDIVPKIDLSEIYLSEDSIKITDLDISEICVSIRHDNESKKAVDILDKYNQPLDTNVRINSLEKWLIFDTDTNKWKRAFQPIKKGLIKISIENLEELLNSKVKIS